MGLTKAQSRHGYKTEVTVGLCWSVANPIWSGSWLLPFVTALIKPLSRINYLLNLEHTTLHAPKDQQGIKHLTAHPEVLTKIHTFDPFILL